MTGDTTQRSLHRAARLGWRLAGACSFVLVGACGPQGGTDVGNGVNVSLQLSAYEEAANVPKSRQLTTGVTIDSLYLAVDKVRLVPGASCEGDDEIDLEGPFVADLTGAGIVGGTPMFTTAEDRFCKLRVGYHRLEADKAPAGTPTDIINHSIFVRGTRADGVTFTIASQRDDRFELESTDEVGFALPPGQPNLLFLAYEVGSWIAAVDLDTLGGPTIVIDAQSNTDRLQAFESAVESSARLFKDADDDGKLDPGEHETPLAE